MEPEIKQFIETKCPSCENIQKLVYSGIQRDSKENPVDFFYDCKNCKSSFFLKGIGDFNNKILDNTKICMWRDTIHKDQEKIKKNKNTFNITLAPNKPCHNCGGYNSKCKNYVPLED